MPAFSTPAKGRIYTKNASKSSVDPEHAETAGNYTSEGIPFVDFVTIAFELEPGEFDELRGQAIALVKGDDQGAHSKSLLATYKSNLSNMEKLFYDPFIQVGNLFLDRAAEQSPAKEPRLLKFINTSERPIPGEWGKRKPDVTLVPYCVYYPATSNSKQRPPEGASGSGAGRKFPNSGRNVGAVSSPASSRLPDHSKRKWLELAQETTDGGDEDKDDGDTNHSNHRGPTAANLILLKWDNGITIAEFKKDGPAVPLDSFAGTIWDADDDREQNPEEEGRAAKRLKNIEPAPCDDVEEPQSPSPKSCRGKGKGKAAEGPQRNTAAGGSGRARVNDSNFPSGPLSFPDFLESNTVGETHVDTQLCAYVAEMKSARGTRKHIFSACIHNLTMWLYFHSNSGIIKSNAIDFEQEPELLALYLALFVNKPLPILGYNEFSGYHNPFSLEDKKTLEIGMLFEPILTGNSRATQPVLEGLVLGAKVDVQYCALGQATFVYKLIIPGCDGDSGLVVKFSWLPVARRKEEQMILEARDVNSRHVPEIFGVASAEGVKSPFQELYDSCPSKAPMSEVRVLRALIMREYIPISQITVATDFLVLIRQIMSFIHELYKNKRIVHRDIGLHNLTYYESEECLLVAMLIDYSHAMVPTLQEGSSSDYRSVNFPFTSWEILENPLREHTLRHDLESLLYCTLFYGVGYRQGKDFPRRKKARPAKPPKRMEKADDDHLAAWRFGADRDVAESKKMFIIAPPLFNRKLLLVTDVNIYQFCAGMLEVFREACVTSTDGTIAVTYTQLMRELGQPTFSCEHSCCDAEILD